MSLFSLAGKTALITGSSRGIGKAIAEEMAVQGANVVISSRKAERCEAVAVEIRARHGDNRAAAIPANISGKADLQALVNETRREFGGIDILVCNAATNPYFGPMERISDEAFEKVLSNNILSNHWLIQMVAPEMKARRDGAIVLISSIGAFKGSDVIGAYNVTKAADIQLARNYAVELGPHNIRVNCIAPGLIRTDFARALWEDPERAKRVEQGAPLRRIGEPQDIAGAAVFLASPAGAYMAGQTIVVDGGTVIVEAAV